MGTTIEEINTELAASFAELFAREEFAAQLLQRSFRQPEGWIELILVLALGFGLFWLSEQLIKKDKLARIRIKPLRHIVERILWPLMMGGAGTLTLLAWTAAGQSSVWLRLLVLAANWMLMIRLALAVLHLALPDNRFNSHLERTASAVLWICFLLWVSRLGDWVTGWMRSLQFTVGASRLNLYTILTGLLWVGVVMVLMMWLAKWINDRLMNTRRLDLNLRIVLSKIVKTLLMVLSVLIALPLVGIDLTVLSVFGGALGVGLGFGLQKIASNYVSGFIILADRSIRPGDRLTVNGFTGYVTEITSRFVVLSSKTGASALIPNETFVTSTVINESFTDQTLWQSLDVQVGYDTDLPQALQILREAAAAHERVEGEPNAFVTGFGDNGIDLRVGFWVRDPDNGFLGMFSDILLTVWRRFKEEGIEFPYPQREVRILNQADNTDKPADSVQAA